MIWYATPVQWMDYLNKQSRNAHQQSFRHICMAIDHRVKITNESLLILFDKHFYKRVL